MANIHYFASQGDIPGVARQLVNGVDVDYTDEYDTYTPLMCAARRADAGVDMIRFLVENGADVNATQQNDADDMYNSKNVLSCAIGSGSVEKTQFLLDAGADVQYKLASDYDALIEAMYGRDITKDEDLIPLLTLLIHRGADPTGVSSYGESALRTASNRGRFDAVSVLLNAGADAAQLKWTELMFAVVFGELAEVRVLLEAGAALAPQDHLGRTAWLLSLRIGDLPKAQVLLRAGANRDDRGRFGKPPLAYAVESGNTELVAWLMRQGFDLDVAAENGKTPLMVAANQGDADMVALLVTAGADVNAIQKYEGTALMQAAETNAVECVRILLENDADPDIVPHEFSSPIGATSSLEIARLLLAAGADLSDVNEDVWRRLTGVERRPLECTREQYMVGRNRRFGTANPEVMNVEFWIAMIHCGYDGWGARKHYDPADPHKDREPVWCHSRFGTTITELPDGRIIEIGGEHEDFYDPDFCIYNDVIVYPGDGTFTIFGYPQDIFPPTDFHTATLVGDSIYIIGNTGYMHERRPGETPVYRLCCTTYQITEVETSGATPGWIQEHKAIYQEPNRIIISGGSIFEVIENEGKYSENTKHYSLDLSDFIWSEIDMK